MAKFSSLLDRRLDARPPGPPRPIPARRLPEFFRLCIQLAVFPMVAIDLWSQRFIRLVLRTHYVKSGSCQKRGDCCRYIVMGWPSIYDRIPFLGRLALWWETEVNGFYEHDFDVEPGEVSPSRVRIFSCRHLLASGRCGQYWLRPSICRSWPRLDPFGPPGILKGCGYRVRPRGSIPLSGSKSLPILPSDD